MRGIILVLTNSEDGDHTNTVVDGILENGYKVFRFDSDKFSTGEVSVTLKAKDELSFAITSLNDSVSSEEISGAWYRRPNHFTFKIKDDVQRRYAEAEAKFFLEGLWRTLRAFWVNDPLSLERARNKIFQLSLAKELGLQIPETIITNNPAIARKFVEKRLGKTIFKAIHNELLDYGDGGLNVPTTLLGEEHLDKLELIRNLPAVFQECVEKQYEVRVTLVGEEVFAVKIKPSKDASFNVDWRHPHLMGKVEYSVYDLPPFLVSLCKEMKRRLSLEFCIFDFARDFEGNYIFFEINPNGQWYWLEKETGLPISRNISKLLVSGISS